MKLVMVGNGMAGARTLEELVALAPDLYDVTVFGAEPYANYNRILLSPVLAGEQTIDDIMLNGVDWYEKHGITLHLSKEITKIDRIRRSVETADGVAVGYDRLLLATGSNPIVLTVPGHTLPGVITYRDIHDTHAMISAAASHEHAVVIGGGLLGLEAANGLKQRGMKVSLANSDTFRAAAGEQINVWAARAGAHLVSQKRGGGHVPPIAAMHSRNLECHKPRERGAVAQAPEHMNRPGARDPARPTSLRRMGRVAKAPAASRTRFRPISSLWPSASGPTPRWRNGRDCFAVVGS